MTMTWTQQIRRAAHSLVAGALAAVALVVLPAGAAHAAAVPIDLYAVDGSTTLPDGVSLPVWGYSLDGSPVTAPGGPTITASVGDTVTITLHNQLSVPTSLLVEGQPVPLDLTGVAPGATSTYEFTPAHAGTFLYEATPITGGVGTEYQTALGLHGAIVVLPATPTAANGKPRAYADDATAYNKDAVLVLGEIDPALNRCLDASSTACTDPATFDMRAFHPRYSLINGKAYPDTASYGVSGGQTLLLRYVNAGVDYHSMGVLGARQSVIALDGNLQSAPSSYVAQTFGPGQTADALVTAPAGRATTLLVYDANGMLHNSNPTDPVTPAFGGMLTTVTVKALAAAGDKIGPATTGVTYTPATTTAPATLSAHASDVGHGGSTIQSVEYYVDDITLASTLMDLSSAAATETDATTTTFTLDPGQHVVYVRSQDAAGNWGPFSSVLLTGADASAPTVSGILLTPHVDGSAHAKDVHVSATADDSASGNNTIASGEMLVVPFGTPLSGGTYFPMDVSQAAPVASLDGTIPASYVAAHPEGLYRVFVHATDDQGNQGSITAATRAILTIDNTPPTILASGVIVDPDPTNGLIPFFDGQQNAIRVTVTGMSDPRQDLGRGNVQTWISKAEVFIDPTGTPATGSGIPLTPKDGAFNHYIEDGYVDIPLSTIRLLPGDGPHTMAVRARDAAGNWGDFTTVEFTVDREGPTVDSPLTLTVTPATTTTPTTVQVDATGSDTLSAIAAAEFYVDTNPGAGNGTPMTVTSTGATSASATATFGADTLSDGTHTLYVRMQDAAGNWGPTTTAGFTVSPSGVTVAVVGLTALNGVNGVVNGGDLVPWNGTGFDALWSAATAGLPANATIDGVDSQGPNDLYVSFRGNTEVPGIGTVRPQDVVHWDGTTWSMFFNSKAHGMAGNAKLNIDAVSVANGVLYFSTTGNARVPGVKGKPDNADIYSWNGSRFQRVWDATKHRIAKTANVDGFDRIDGSHFYLSFSGTATHVPHLGKVRDEDVVGKSGQIWFNYFDGSLHGMGGSSVNVNGFYIP